MGEFAMKIKSADGSTYVRLKQTQVCNADEIDLTMVFRKERSITLVLHPAEALELAAALTKFVGRNT
jgi:hypothetical protein